MLACDVRLYSWRCTIRMTEARRIRQSIILVWDKILVFSFFVSCWYRHGLVLHLFCVSLFVHQYIYLFATCHSWRMRLAKQETLTSHRHIFSPVVSKDPPISTYSIVCATTMVQKLFCILYCLVAFKCWMVSCQSNGPRDYLWLLMFGGLAWFVLHCRHCHGIIANGFINYIFRKHNWNGMKKWFTTFFISLIKS